MNSAYSGDGACASIPILENKVATITSHAAHGHAFALPAGTVRVDVHGQAHADIGLDQLCSFAARNNPKRGFLVVSKVLGRHMPTTPAMIRDIARLMALELHEKTATPSGSALAGPVVFLGMAETAVCLGHSLFSAFADLTGRQDLLFIHSTRQIPTAINQPILCTFAEPHSHAAAHMIHEPVTPEGRLLLTQARTLVVIDDETSTGTTFLNAVDAIRPVMPQLKQLATAVITDWSVGQDWQQHMPLPHAGISLLQGTLHWEPDPAFVSRDPPITQTGALGRLPGTANHGRGGIHHGNDSLLGRERYAAAAGQIIAARDRPNYLVLGTGEFTYPAFLLAEQLQARGKAVHIQATTRSPIHLGGAIQTRIELSDNYGSGVPNFLYNVGPDAETAIILCHETETETLDPMFIDTLHAIRVDFSQGIQVTA